MAYTSLSQIQDAIKKTETNIEKLVRNYLSNIETNRDLNAFLEVFEAESIQRAQALDAKFARGEQMGRLFGLVIGLKDNICYKDHKVSASSKILEGFESIYSSTAVERLLSEDAIILGRLNCDEFAMGSSTENSAFGNVLNPIDRTRVPGGSSGGSAAAVKADLCHATLGSDTGGSIRQPASFCDIVGFKPTYGRISRHGLIAYSSSFDQIGPFTKSVEDTKAIYEAIAGRDEFDATTSAKPIHAVHPKKTTYKIAYFPEVLNSEGVSAEVKEACQDFLKKAKEQGHEIVEYSFKYLDYLIPIYYVLTTAEASSNLARFDGVKYGYRSKDANDLEELYVRSRSEGFGPEVKRRIMLGTFVLSAGYYDAYYTKAQKVRRILRDEMSKLLTDCDFLFTPTCPSVPFKFGDKTSNPIEMYFADIFTVLANIVGMPAISLPLYKNAAGLPMGMQLMSHSWEEEKLFDFGMDLMEKIK
ncbi:MAG: Asp-tRNA(Asn)/Glu-tRNA(Gln) amidotransferase subunit GatA [Bacteroidetes bacterium]|nr:Asp-tRNA(Asn)/Glu-tRNA(Gln) amidotransferase subunit GatA [Bacteroidota bacterium]